MALQVNYRYKHQVTDKARRKQEGIKVKRKFPAKIPLVVGRANKSELPELEKSKFLFPATAKVGDLVHFINSKMNRSEQAPLFIYADNEIVASPANLMSELYQEFREDDFFLYLAYYEENIYHLHHYRHFSGADRTSGGSIT